MNMTRVEINAQHKYRTVLFGNLYLEGRCVGEDFLRSIGLCEEYDPEVSLDDVGDASEEV